MKRLKRGFFLSSLSLPGIAAAGQGPQRKIDRRPDLSLYWCRSVIGRRLLCSPLQRNPVFKEVLSMRDSTRQLVRTHGWRIDRFVHNYLYFVLYAPYVRVALALDRIRQKAEDPGVAEETDFPIR
jgi:hypothetical protein